MNRTFLINRIRKSQFLTGTIVLLIGNNLANFGNFLYNLSMGRLLGPEKYGELGAILSLFIILGAPLSILNLLVIKVVSAFWGKKDKMAIIIFWRYFTPKIFLVGAAFSIILISISPLIARFLMIDSLSSFLVIALSFMLAGPLAVNNSVIQGTLSFSFLTLNTLIQSLLKLVLSIILVILNFSLLGAVLGPFLGNIIVYLVTMLEMRLILGTTNWKKIKPPSYKLLNNFIPVTIGSLALTAFLTMDIVMVKHFFSPHQAGEYVALATVSKIILYGIGPLVTVMFPLVANRASSGLPYILPLLGTLVLSLGLASVMIFSFFFAPRFIISVLFGNRYFGIIPFLGLFSFYMTIYTINNILTNFILSISYYKPMYLLFAISLLPSLLIILFHNQISQVIWINIISSLIYFFVIFFHLLKKEKKELARIFLKVVPLKMSPPRIYETKVLPYSL